MKNIRSYLFILYGLIFLSGFCSLAVAQEANSEAGEGTPDSSIGVNPPDEHNMSRWIVANEDEFNKVIEQTAKKSETHWLKDQETPKESAPAISAPASELDGSAGKSSNALTQEWHRGEAVSAPQASASAGNQEPVIIAQPNRVGGPTAGEPITTDEPTPEEHSSENLTPNQPGADQNFQPEGSSRTAQGGSDQLEGATNSDDTEVEISEDNSANLSGSAQAGGEVASGNNRDQSTSPSSPSEGETSQLQTAKSLESSKAPLGNEGGASPNSAPPAAAPNVATSGGVVAAGAQSSRADAAQASGSVGGGTHKNGSALEAAGSAGGANEKLTRYTVEKGDTLYSISNKFKISLPELRHLNNMGPHENDILVGEKLIVGAKSLTASEGVGIGGGFALKPSRAASGAPAASARAQDLTPKSETRPARAYVSTAKGSGKDKMKFMWPLVGRVLVGFGSKTIHGVSEGINIMSVKGQAVKSAQEGIVIYAGALQRGSGTMVLVQHKNGWITVYGYLSSNLEVNKGDYVTQGQVIGYVGLPKSTHGTPQLHFELRHNVKPKNPVDYLDSHH